MPIARSLACLICPAFAVANELPEMDGGMERESGGIIEELLENHFGTSGQL